MVVGRPFFVSYLRRPISLLNCLRRGQKKRQSREKLRSYVSTYSTAEQLEDRTLLAGASLVNIEPNIDLSLTDGEVYNQAPSELTFKFTPGQQINPDTLGAIQIVRSGLDGTFTDGNEVPITPGYIGIGENPNEVILRFAESLPDDHYQITILGTGANPLLNQNDEAFQDGVDQVIDFELDLGAKVTSVVTQPVLRDQILSVDDVANLQDGDTFTISMGAVSTTFEMDLDGLGLNDPANVQVSYSAADSTSTVAAAIVAAFESSLLDSYGTISINTDQLTIQGNSFTPAISFSLLDPLNPGISRADGALVAHEDQILIYFNNDDLDSTLANDPRFYQIIDTTGGNLTPIATTDYTATYDPLSDVTVLKFTSPLIAGAHYRLRVGVSDAPDEIGTDTYTTLGADSVTISVLAGSGGNVTPINGMLITDLNLNDLKGLVINGAGDYYFIHDDGSDIRILRIDHTTNEITVLAGDGTTDVSSPSLPALLSGNPLASGLNLSSPGDLALDVDGNVYFTDGAYVLKIDSVTQFVTVIAGGGTDTQVDPGDVPTDLLLDTPDQLAIDSEGNVYFHDSGLNQLMLIDGHSGLVLGSVPTEFGTPPLTVTLDITDLEVDPVGNLFFATPGIPLAGYDPGIYFIDIQSGHSVFHGGISLDFSDLTPVLIAGGGSDTTPTSGDLAADLDLSSITDFDFDANGYLYYTDLNGYVVQLDPYAVDPTIQVISGAGSGGSITNGEPANTADINTPTSLAIGTGNSPYFFDNGYNSLLRIENLPDQNSSFDTATDLTDLAHQWNAGMEEFVISSKIEPQGIGLPPLPGGNDEPGHRQLPAGLDSHVGSSGTAPVAGGTVSVVYYNFRDAYGFDVQGNQLLNAITEEQKERTREIFEIYAYYLGVEFIESASSGITVVTGDLRVADPGLPVGPGGVGGVSTGGTVIMDSSDFTGPQADVYGGSWMQTAFHEIGHSLGLGHAYDLPSLMGNALPQAAGQTVFPGDHDLVHLNRLYRNDANDIDLYKFDLSEAGTFRAEIFAERLNDVSLLNSTITLYDADHNVVARNDDYYSNDSFLELFLDAGTYFIGVTSTGNDNYNPEIENSGDNGSTDGEYELRLNFAPDPVVDELDPNNTEILVDETGIRFDGDSDGTPGGAYDFWFVASDATNTIYVDKTAADGGDGSLGAAFNTVAGAINAINTGASTAEVIRILGNGGTDGDLRTTDDSLNYNIGYDDFYTPLEDGESIIVPQGVTVVIDQGAVIKLQNTVIDVGSSSVLEDRSHAALQIQGTNDTRVVLTSYGNDAIGGNDDGPSDGANPGDWGGIIFRNDSDYESDSVFLNYVANADISYGGGQVYSDSVLQTFAPIHIDEARPTLAYNSITYSANAAVSASPNSFDESIVDDLGNYNHDQTLKRIGPDIYGNTIINNSLNGLFIRTETLFGQQIDSVKVTAHFDDTDIVHIITENLFIDAGTGGPIVDPVDGLQARYSGSVNFDPGTIVKLGGARIQTGRGNAGIIAEGTEESPVIFTSIFDDRYGAGGTFDTTNNDLEGANERDAIAGDWGGLILNQTSHGSIDHAVIAYGGGVVPIEGFSDSFNAIEVHQADLRVANTLFENNRGVASSTDRNSLGRNEATTIFVRGAQPIVVNNQFVNNGGSVININANSMKSDILEDYGRSTGLNDAFDELDGNAGPLVRLNQFKNDDPDVDSVLGMVIRGELLTVESVWDDTDIDHVVYNTITVDNFHTYGGLRLQSSTEASLVVKFGSGAGITATGHGLDINDRIGGTVQILGDPQNPVVMTSIYDDTVGSGIGLDGYSVTETVTNQSAAPAAGDWTGLQFLEFSNDRNVEIFNEKELAVLDSNGDINGIVRNAQYLGELAPNEKSGDENRRLGFEVHGSIASNNSGDADIYSFNAEAGTDVWIDIDRTGLALDSVVELLDPLGRVLARANNNTDAFNPGESPVPSNPEALIQNSNFGGDFYTSNPKDAGMHIKLPGFDGILTTYFIRVRSNSTDLSDVNGGQSNGEYQLQVRLRQVDEEPGSTVRYADIHYANDAIYLAGLPAHSPLINETVESGEASSLRGSAQNLGNLLASDRNTIGVSGTLNSSGNDVDFYQFDLTIQDIQSIAGVNAGGKTWSTIFDIDYADGLGRADTTLSVFDSNGRLIFVSRESNVEDDLVHSDAEKEDLSRGSFGTLDPYIGSVHLPEAGTYYVAVSSHTQLARAMEATYNGSNANAQVRLEPINSLQRVVEDHIGSQGYNSNGVDIEPDGALFDITDSGIDTHVTGFDLSDVVLFTTNGHNLATVDPQEGVYETNVGDINGTSAGTNQITDMVMRSDGVLYGIQNNRLVIIDTAGSYSGNTPVTSRQIEGTTNIPTISGSEVLPAQYAQTTTNLSRQLSLFNNRGTGSSDVSIQAMTFARTTNSSGARVYELYYVVTETGYDSSGNARTFQKLYQANPTTGAVLGDTEENNDGRLRNGFRGYLLNDDVTVASASVSGGPDADNNTGTLYFQSVVPGIAGNDIQIIFMGHDAADDIVVNRATGTITVRLDQRSSGANAWTMADIANAINGNDDARDLVKVGIIGNSSTNAYEAFGTPNLSTSGGTGNPDYGFNLPVVQGMAFNNFHVNTNGGTSLIGVTQNGKVLEISLTNNAFLGQGLISNELADYSGSNYNFTGASLGPQNLYDGAYSDYVFATTNDGTLVALDPSGALMSVFGNNITTPDSGNTSADIDTVNNPADIQTSDRPEQVPGNIQGLAFSPLDFNLWHTTRTQGTVDGHGINEAPDNSRTPSAVDLELDKLASNQHNFNQSDGALSFYFGLEQFTTGDNTYLSYEAASAQLGILDTEFLRDLTSNSDANIGNNVNLPGGAMGSLTTNTFSLEGFGAKDAPTIYFNYFLETENTNSSTSNQMRDSARVYLQDDSGVWHLIATNNSTKSTSSNDWELPTYITHTASENTNPADTGRDYVQELFDNTGVWRQARVDLSSFAGQSNLKLRFDYSTAGTINNHGDFDSDIHGDVTSAFNSSRRGQNNTGEGFYIDDIIVGSAERGEMVTGSSQNVDSFYNVYGTGNAEPEDAADTIVTGSYTLEIRRGTEYAVLVSPVDPQIAIAQLFDTNTRLVEEDGLLGDDNFRREQGMILINGNQIFDSTNGIVVNTVGPLASTDGFPHQGGTRALTILNTDQLAPGAVLQNNLIVDSTLNGIDIIGNINTPESVSPLVKVVNNTVYGGLRGINAFSRVSPTIVNNIVANTVGGIVVDTVFSNTVVDNNLYYHNTGNGTLGSHSTVIPLSDTTSTLFVDAAARNFYLADNSKAIDSSLNRLADRSLYAAVKDALGIPASDIFAPSYDVYGQLRVDDPTQSPPPGLGSNIFKDLGAIERSDFVGPTAVITLPPDNDVNDTDLDPDPTKVYISNPELFTTMIVELRDTGIGVDDNVVISAQFTLTATTSTGTIELQEGTDYVFSYNSNTNEATFTAASGVFSLDTLYTIDVDNSAATGVQDLAGNRLQANQNDGTTTFTILVSDGVNDPPINHFDATPIPDSPNVTVTTDPGLALVFSAANGNALTVTDQDSFLGTQGIPTSPATDGMVTVTLSTLMTEGKLAAGPNTSNVTINLTDDGTSYFLEITGLIEDVNTALDGVSWTPLSTPTDGSTFAGATASLTMTTDDNGNFFGDPSQTDTDVIDIVVTALPEVFFNTPTYSLNEDGTTTVTVELERDKIGLVTTVDLLFGAGDTEAIDFTTPPPAQVIFAANELTAEVVFTIFNDDIVELDEQFTLTIDTVDNGTKTDGLIDDGLGGTLTVYDQTTITIVDNDTATITFVETDLTVAEDVATGYVEYTVHISNAVENDVQFFVTSADGTSLVEDNASDENTDDDYTSVNELVTFTNSITPAADQTFQVFITDDNKLELDEIFSLYMNALTAGGLESKITLGSPAQVTITDDSDLAVISFVDDDIQVNEEIGSITFTVQIDNSIAKDISFDVSTVDGTSMTMRNASNETLDDDYTSKTQSFTFLGTPDTDVVSNTQDFVVTIINDNKLELDEVFNVFMSNLNANGLNDRTERVTFASPSSTPAKATILDDSDLAEISFVDDDLFVNEEDGSVTFIVQIDSAIAEDISFDVSTENGTSITMRNASDENTDDDFTSKTQNFTFLGTQDTDVIPGTQNFVVTITNDDKLELDEVFNVFMSNLNANGLNDRTTRITFASSVGTPAHATILDDSDTATISFVDNDLFVNEEDGSVTFSVQISNAIAENVSLDLTTQDGTSLTLRNATDESSDNDYTSKTETITFLGTLNTDTVPGTQNFVVNITNDNKLELDEIFDVFMSNLNANGLNDRGTRISMDTINPAQATILDDSDVTEISFVNDDVQVNEEDGSVTFTVQIDNAIAEDISFDVSTIDGTSISMRNATDENTDDDYTSKSQSFTFLGTQNSDPDVVPGTQDFIVTIINDDKLELDEVFNVFMSNLNANGLNDRTTRVTFASPSNNPAQATIVDDSDVASITFLDNDVTVNEEGAIVLLTAQISNAIAEDVSFDFYTQDGTSITMRNATDENIDDDYSSKRETHTFLGTPNTDVVPGIKTFVVSITNDDKLELDEVFNVLLDSLSANGLESRITLDSPAQVTIKDDSDTATISFVNDDVAANEEDGTITFDIYISNAIAEDIIFDLTTKDGTPPLPAGSGIATDESLDDDYKFKTQSFTFVGTPDTDNIPGTQSFTVTITNDEKVELDELFNVFIDNLNANGLDSRITLGADATGIIRNNDSAIITVDPVISAGVNEGSGTGTTNITFNVNISKAIDTNVSFFLSTQDNTATVADNDYLPVLNQLYTFLGSPNSDVVPGQQTFTVQIAQDKKVELDELFNVIVTNLNASGRNVTTGIAPAAQGTILNDDSATVTINNVSKLESEGNFVFTATLSNPVDSNVSVEVYTQHGTGLITDSDYNAVDPLAPIILNFTPNGALTQNFTITVNDDNIVEGDEFFSTILANLDAALRNVSVINGTDQGHIRDNDSAKLSITPVIDTENNSPFQFLVQLSNPVDVAITVDASTIDGTATSPNDYQGISGQTLTFGPGVTQVPLNITVFNDIFTESPETFEVILDNLVPNGRAVFLTSVESLSSVATSDAAVAVDVVGNYAYVADRDGGLQIYNIANPAAPFHAGEFDFNNQGIAQAIDVVGNLAYLAVGEAGLQIINIANPAAPVFVGSIATPARARGVQVIGNLAYVADDSGNGGGLQIVDVSNPAAPSILGSFGVSTPGGLAGGVEVIGNIAYLTDGNNGLQIVNVTDSSNPTLIKNVLTPGGAAIGLDVVGNYAFVANREGGLQVIDISTPATASIVGTLNTPGVATGVQVDGNFAYVADGAFGLQVIDITNPTSPILINTFDTPSSARSLFVNGTLAFVADTFSGLQILEFFPSTTATGTILDPSGPPLTGTASPNTTISTSIVKSQTTTDANGETGSVPESEAWVDEWDSFWVEVWGTTTDGSGITGGSFDLEYNTDFFTATAVDFGSAFGSSSSSSIDDQTGIVSGISGQNGVGTLGSSKQVLLARVKFESLADDGVAIDTVAGFLGPHNLGIRVINAQLDVAGTGAVTASVATAPTTDLWAVPFDLDDSGLIDFKDLLKFSSFYGTSVINASSGLAWSLDFDKSGQINFKDLTFLATNYNRSKASGQSVIFPPNFPQEWYGSSITTDGDDSLNDLIDAAVDEWKTATGNQNLSVQVVVTDLGGQQLGEGHILELDENGIPVKGRVYIDDDAAGLGWYSSIEGLSFDSNGEAIAGSAADGHYDLYTVLLHEIGHAAGFTTGYSAYADHVETSGSGQVQFVSWDLIAPLTDDGLHIDENFYPEDLMGEFLDPSVRKSISTLDVRILQAAYADAAGAVISPLSAPLTGAGLDPTPLMTSAPVVDAPAATTCTKQSVGVAPAPALEPASEPTTVETASDWGYTSLTVQDSVLNLDQSSGLDQLVGSLLDNSYETDQLLTNDFDSLESDEYDLGFEFEDNQDLNAGFELETAGEEVDDLFADWSGPLI